MTALSPDAEIEILRTRARKLAEEKSHLQLLVQLIEQLNPLPGLENMVSAMIQSIGQTIGGTNLTLYYWAEDELHRVDFQTGHRIVEGIDDPLVQQAADNARFIEAPGHVEDGLLVGEVQPLVWTWVFPLTVGSELVGVFKLENIHIAAATWREYLPILFSHAALILSNEIRTRARLKAEAKLVRWAQIFEHAGWGIVIGSADGKSMELMNNAFARMHGFEVDELMGAPIEFLYAPEERPKLPDIIRRAHEEGHVTVESSHIRKDGSIFPVLLDLTTLRGEDGEVQYRIVNVQDMTQAKEAEDRLRRSVDALTRSNVELERFAYIASHDLQEPLRSLIAYSQLLERRHLSALTGDAREFLGYIVTAATRMHTLVHDLLAYSRVSSQGQPFDAVDFAAAVAVACDNLRASIQDSQATVDVGDMPTLMADEGQIVEIFQNLIGNAIKFRRRGVPAVVTIRAQQGETSWTFSVADNGIGIQEDYLEKIFIIFQRLHTQAAYPGTGIGLAVCKRILERHGGRIWAESRDGEGSTFYFTLPKNEEPSVPAAPATPSRTRCAGT